MGCLLRRARALGVLVAVVAVSTQHLELSSSADASVAPVVDRPFRPPVIGTVIDRFRPPATPYGPGNRGVEYAVAPGAAVHAVGNGMVAFAGPVGGVLVVSVDHPGGLRSSYLGLRSIGVAVGDTLRRGQRIGTSTARLHLGIRSGGRYLDPEQFFAQSRAVLRPPPGRVRAGMSLSTTMLGAPDHPGPDTSRYRESPAPTRSLRALAPGRQPKARFP